MSTYISDKKPSVTSFRVNGTRRFIVNVEGKEISAEQQEALDTLTSNGEHATAKRVGRPRKAKTEPVLA